MTGLRACHFAEPRCDEIGPDIALRIVQLLTLERDRAEGAIRISWIELVFLLDILGFDHPCLVSLGGRTCWRARHNIAPAQDGQVTCAGRLRFLKLFFKLVDSVGGGSIDYVGSIDLSHLRIHPPQQGLLAFISRSAQTKIDERILNWTKCRAVRTTNDLTRPI